MCQALVHHVVLPSSLLLSLLLFWNRLSRHAATAFATDTSSTSAYVVIEKGRLTRQDAADIIDTVLFPPSERNDRMNAGRDAQGLNRGGAAIIAEDPRMTYTYAEFPLSSFDELVNKAVDFLPQGKGDNQQQQIRIVDLGSGCGRLVMYAALSRKWKATGIEIGKELHDSATAILKKGIAEGYFASSQSPGDDHGSVQLHLGPAEEFDSVLQSADIIFAYSTVFAASKQFNTGISAMVLSSEWSELIARQCSKNCIVITTDRAMDPKHGWNLVGRQDVENPEVFGSTGFIQTMQK